MYGSYMFPFPYVVSLNEALQVFEVLKEEATVSSVCRKKKQIMVFEVSKHEIVS